MKVKYINFVIYLCLLHLFYMCNSKETVVSTNDAETQEIATLHLPEKESLELGSRVVHYAGTLLGTPYKEAGRDSTGFDCSGFIYYVFKKYQIDVPHSSRHLAELGTEVTTAEARPGDLVFFRGTNPDNTEVGHVGIVITSPGQPIKFIHASSASTSAYVKYDSLAKPNYSRRFIKVKRILSSLDKT